MIKVSKALVAANEAQDSALKRLSSGKGNLVRQTEQLKALGAKTTKSVPFGLIEDDLPALPDVPVPDPE
jgi:DNA recombination protein RmuC